MAKNSYSDYKNFHKSNKTSEDDFKVVIKVRDYFDKAKRARQQGCYHKAGSTTSANWESHWAKQEKARYMWASEPSTDSFQSNVKSPMIAGRVISFVNNFKKLNLGWTALPNTEKDKNAAKVASKLLDYWFNTSDVKLEMAKCADSAATYGSAIFRVSYVEKIREFRFPKTNVEEMSDDEKELVLKKKVVYGEKQKVVIYNDPVLEYVPIREYYPDPQATSQHGVYKECRYGIRRYFITVDDFKNKFKSNPNAKNISLVKPMAVYSKSEVYNFFRPPEDAISQDMVEVLEYENALDDQYCVVANDILIINTPLPYNHKELTYHKIDFIKIPDQYYGMGIADMLMNTQGSQEIFLNMLLDYMFRSYNLRYFIDAASYGELSEDMIRTDTQLIPIDLSDNRPIGSKIQQLSSNPIGFDAFNMNDLIERFATIASQIDPSQLSLMQAGRTATATLQNREQFQSMINGVVDNFVLDGITNAGRQIWKLCQQFYSIPRVTKIVDGKTEVKNKTIRLENIVIEMKDEELTFKQAKNEHSLFELKEEYLATQDELTISIKPDTIEAVSKGVEMQKMKEEFAQLMQFAVDPSNTQALMQHPMPMVNAVKLFQKYFEVEGLPDDLLITPEQNEEAQIRQAEEDVMMILKGQFVPGRPGVSEKHREFEAKVLLALDAQRSQLQQEIDDDVAEQEKKINMLIEEQQQMPQFDPMTGEPLALPPLPEIIPNEAKTKEIDRLNVVIGMLQKHLAVDNMPAGMLKQAAIEQAQANEQKQIEAQQKQMQPPMPPGVDQSVPMPEMPSEMGGEGGFDVPMPQPMQDPSLMV